VLIGETPEQLQQLLDVLQKFCEEENMVVNFSKTKVVVFNASNARRTQRTTVPFKLGDRVLEFETEYKYLGLLLKHSRMVPNLIKSAARRGQQAVAMLYRRAARLGVHSNINIKLRLYNAIVLPNLTFGCEVWGPWLLNSDIVGGAFQNLLEQVRLAFYRSCLRVRRATSSWALYRELGEYPLQLYVVRQVILFANKLRNMPQYTWAKRAMLDAWLAHRQGCQNWWTKLVNFCDGIGVQPVVAGGDNDWPCYSASECVLAIMQLGQSVFQGTNVRTKDIAYHQHFGMHLSEVGTPAKAWQRAPYLMMAMDTTRVCKLARFRLSGHYLVVETSRWRRGAAAGDLRVHQVSVGVDAG
jgi:hypothetical protein